MLSAWMLATWMFLASAALANAPTLYSNPDYESPVRAGPDDLLMLAGDGFSADDMVIYAAIGDTSQTPQLDAVPAQSTADIGYATVVANNDVPYSLTIKFPAVFVAHRAYALWVRTSHGELSMPIKINDARPLWLTPAYAYSTAALAGLPRYLKVVGRNLGPGPNGITAVRLFGPQTVSLAAERTSSIVDTYVAQTRLPPRLRPGRYRVAVTRDGRSWVELRDQRFDVLADPVIEAEFSVSDSRFGGCRPDDGQDDSTCVIRAIAAASAAGGGAVTFAAGVWNFIDSGVTGITPGDGIVVPEGVSLLGKGANATRLLRDPRWNAAAPTATFTFRGNSVVEGFTFADSQIYVPADRTGAFLQVGENSVRIWGQSHTAPTVRNVVITHNRFDRTDTAIGDAGLPMERLFVTYNEFGTYRYQLELGGNPFDVTHAFRLDDTVIAHNVFKPGSFLDTHDQLGPIASEIGAAHRLDFSDNTADGVSTEYLYSPDDARGWRAGFFWHMNNSSEMLLISNNSATCTGDRIGDGEALALDNSGNTFAFEAMRPVLAADASSVTVDGPLAARQNDRDVPLASYYIGHWLQIGDGPGRGQVRKITAYSVDPATNRITFTVAPRWDVIPRPQTTRISVGREFWQTLVLANRIDDRLPCQKSHRSRAAGGEITLWAQIADSVVAGNVQHDTDGVSFHENYHAPLRTCAGCGAETYFQSFLEIRDNVIDGKYDTTSDCTPSGIFGGVSAAPGSIPPPTLGYGVAISYNQLVHADNALMGAIGVRQDWFDGPAPHEWPLLDNLIIQHNRIEGIAGPVSAGAGCNAQRRGIAFPGSPLTWRAVLYANSCAGVALSLGEQGKDTVLVCPDSAAESCECVAARGSGTSIE